VRGAAAQFDGFLGSLAGEGPFPAEMMQAVTGRLTQAGSRPIAWTPAISAAFNLESLKQNDEPLDDPRVVEQLPELIAADIKGSLASLPRTRRDFATGCASSTRRRCPAARLGRGAPGHLHCAPPGETISTRGLPVLRAIRAVTHDAATAMGVGHQSGAISPGNRRHHRRARRRAANPAAAVRDVVIKHGRRVR
jgi:hypothetical protein